MDDNLKHKTNFFNSGMILSNVYTIGDTYCNSHSVDGKPSRQLWWENGNINEIEYHKDGIEHREDGPCNIIFRLNGRLISEVWKVNGKCHREDGPAMRIWHDDNDDEVVSNYYYLFDEKIETKEEYLQMVRDITLEKILT